MLAGHEPVEQLSRLVADQLGVGNDAGEGRVAEFADLFLVIGVGCGLLTTSITSVMMWLVGALSSGFVAANVLKWYWWRFNGFGYFWGMISGIAGALLFWVAEKVVGQNFNALYTFPILLVISLLGCLAGTYLAGPEDDATLKKFYKIVNPRGCG